MLVLILVVPSVKTFVLSLKIVLIVEYLVLIHFQKAKDKKIQRINKNKRSSPTVSYNNGNYLLFLVINFSTIDYYLLAESFFKFHLNIS